MAPETTAKSTSQSTFAAQPTSAGGGFGSRPVVQPSDTLSAFQARVPPGNVFGGLSTVDSAYKSNLSPATQPPKVQPPAMPSSSVDAVRVRDQGLLVVREVEDNNSCLFNAIAYTLDPTMKNNIQGLRQIVAQAIEVNPDAYSDVVLGIDVSTNRVDRFDYDALAITPGLDIPSECDQTQFDANSEDIINAGVQLAAKLKKAHKYTDLATFTLRCSICQAGLKGEKDAQQHAQQTSHTSFEEYR
ncbi:ubiquitin-specific protease otu1 [Mortierella sp. AD094]|nr:ubiquitin-specific protease otu1 [Mortierella sp. AD094]